MTDPTSSGRRATLKDLEAMVTRASHHPSEREKLAAAPEDALQQAGFAATPAAVEFLKSLGKAKFNESDQDTKPMITDPLKGGAGEM